jgi:serine protease Do
MKKTFIFISLFLVSLVFVSCTTDFGTTIGITTSTQTTTNQTQTTTIGTVDIDKAISEVYEMIYNDLYEKVKAEVIQNISDEQFDEIYSQVLLELMTKVEDGTITIQPADIIDMIYNVQATKASAVVGIITNDSSGTTLQTGSGVIYKKVSNTYYVVTNEHVTENGSSYQIYLEDGSTIDATLLGVDALVDLAVLKFISEDEYVTADFADSSLVNKGDIVLAVGNPQGMDFYGTITMGIVSGTDRYFDNDGDGVRDMFVNYIQHDAAINGGNSGGALFNINGDIIGINVIKISATEVEGMGFAIPSNLVSAIVSDIEQYGVSLQKPVLGINFIEIRDHIDYLITQGAVIPNGVEDGFYVFAVAEGASFYGYVQADDIILAIDDIVLTTAENFVVDFSRYRVGDTVSITINRNGTVMTIDDIVLKAKVVG